MRMSSKFLAGLFAYALLTISTLVSASTAKADIGPRFWEDSRPNVTGARPRVAKKVQEASGERVASARPKRAKAKRFAARGDVDYDPRPARRSGSVAGGGGITWQASASCLDGRLASVIRSVAANCGSVRVSSTCRSRSRNARVGGARKSFHLTGDAADFRVFGPVRQVYAFLRSHGSVGGLKHYGGGLFHIDTGPRRGW
jgi:hypothetical protein